MPVSPGCSCTLLAEFIDNSVPLGAFVVVVTLLPLLPPHTSCGKGS